MNNRLDSGFAPAASDVLQARFARRVTAALDERARALPHDASERLRAAREQALERARLARRQTVAVPQLAVAGGGSRSLGGTGGSWWLRLGAALPLVALVAGLVMIQRWHVSAQISDAVEIDAALLADDLPPSAYADPGFVEFLKAPPN